ncbi:hypothetical protein DY000_02063479 [Brassica cretica]|uniref:DUF4283 domain-containing protein n=1 Tax=Brassica cretica TaxID=69181 RepID=A0ABQ7ANC6_BRACR|nr:hypothetical protein DY000_02063479 [Brassica cretica]
MSRRNRVEQVITTGCNPEKRSKEHQSGVTTIGVKVELSDKNWNSQAKGEICRLGRVGTSCLNKSGFRFSYSLRKSSWVRVLTRGELWSELLVRSVLIGSAEGVKVSVSNMASSREKELKGKCPQESPLANGQILIDGQIRWWSKDTCVDSLPNHVVLGGVSCLSVQRYKEMLKCNLIKNIKVKLSQGCVESLSNSDDWMAAPVQSSSVFKEFDSRLSAHEWNRKAKEEINLQKDVQFSVQAFEHVRDFDSKLGSQLKTIDEGDGFKEDHEGTSRLAQGGAERSEKEIREDNEMQKMSKLAQALRGVGTNEGLWTSTKQVEFCEAWSKPIRQVQC